MPQEEQWLLQEKFNGEKSPAFFADCKRLALGEPLAYLIGHASFLDCKIWLDSKPLIPRPETEFWTEQAIKIIEKESTLSLGITDSAVRVLDLCSGSGCIGVSVAKHILNSVVDFSELDEDHLPTIEKNLQENDIPKSRYNIHHTSLFDDLNDKYDYIFSNPPYIDETLNRVDESVTMNEPHLALFGGRGGMDIISEIIIKAPRYLKTGGQLWIEHEPEQSEEISQTAQENNFSVNTYKDQYKIDRYSILVLQ